MMGEIAHGIQNTNIRYINIITRISFPFIGQFDNKETMRMLSMITDVTSDRCTWIVPFLVLQLFHGCDNSMRMCIFRKLVSVTTFFLLQLDIAVLNLSC